MKLSISIPVYNDEDCVEKFFISLKKCTSEIIKAHPDLAIEFLFIDNCSTDKTFEKIQAISQEHPTAYYVRQSRNFGYQSSIFLALNIASGDYLSFIDVDGEDPPELIPQFFEKCLQGYDLAYGDRINREEVFILRSARKVFYRLTASIADWDFVLDMAEFFMISDRLRNVVLKSKSTFPFIRSEVAYAGFNRVGIPYKRKKRIGGSTHYNLIGMFVFAIGGILSASTFPLRAMSYLSLIAFLTTPILLFVGLTESQAQNIPVFIALVNMLFISVVGLYVARIYKNIANRPIFIIDEEKSNYPGIVRTRTVI